MKPEENFIKFNYQSPPMFVSVSGSVYHFKGSFISHIPSYLTTFYLNKVHCDRLQPRRTGSRTVKLPISLWLSAVMAHAFSSVQTRSDEIRDDVIMNTA